MTENEYVGVESDELGPESEDEEDVGHVAEYDDEPAPREPPANT